jgi:uncharacterized protein (DUF1800 family)
VTLDQTTAVAMLHRRLGFGATADELSSAVSAGYAATVRSLLAGLSEPDPGADAVTPPVFTPPPAPLRQLRANPAARQAYFEQQRQESRQLIVWWLARMVGTSTPAHEKLTFLLHGHFPTAISKVRYPQFMYRQNQLFRTQGSGDFAALTQAVAIDPAMLIWLDAATDLASDPNENFARELLERFTMGIGTYTEADVRAAAYCFTGWQLDLRTGQFSISALDHSNASQTFLGQPGINSGAQVIEIATSTSASAHYVPSAIWSHIATPVSPTSSVAKDLAPGYAANRSMATLLQSIVEHPDFLTTTTLNGLVKQPVEYVVGVLRALGVTAAEVERLPGGLLPILAGMGQIPFDPPSVGGWDQNGYWLSTAAALVRWGFARDLAHRADISLVADAPKASRVDAAAQLLSVPTWSSATATGLARAAGNAPELVTLALVSPEYVRN